MSPGKKKARLDESVEDEVEDSDFEFGSSSGFIRYEANVADISSTAFLFSPTIEVLGMPWNLCLGKNPNAPFLDMFLRYRRSSSDIWSFDVSGEFIIRSFAEGGTAISKGFAKDGKVTIEVRFTLSDIVGISIHPRIDFTNADEPRHDVTLVIEGEKIYASKQILAVYSPVFNAMFFGDFVEKNKNEIELKDINRKEFVEMLNLIYPSYAKITDANAEYLLKLGDRFQIKTIVDQIEQFLIHSTKLSVSWKYKLSDQFRLVKLQDHCLDNLTTVQDIQDLKMTDGYEALSDKAKVTLLERVMALRVPTQ